MIDYELRGGKYHLYLNGEALFSIYGKFGQEKSILDLIEPVTKDGYENMVWILCELSRQGELYRRIMGETPAEYLEYVKVITQMQPVEIPEAKKAVIMAVTEGFRRDHPDQELEEDPWLLEIESKKKRASRGPSICERFRRALASLFGKE